MSPTLRSVLVALACSLALDAAGQEPANQGVKSTATVEVLDDTAHVDDVISQLKKQPEANPAERSPTAKANPPAVQSLKGERPDLSTEVADQEKRGKSAKEEKRGGWRWQRRLEERTEHVRKAHNP